MSAPDPGTIFAKARNGTDRVNGKPNTWLRHPEVDAVRPFIVPGPSAFAPLLVFEGGAYLMGWDRSSAWLAYHGPYDAEEWAAREKEQLAYLRIRTREDLKRAESKVEKLRAELAELAE